MGYKRKTWQQKLEDNKSLPKTLKLEKDFPCFRPLAKMGAKIGDSVVIAPPSSVLSVMKKVPEGKLITLEGICRRLAKQYNTQYCCTLTTGIHVTIAANATEEMKSDTPYWRTIKNNGELKIKYPGGADKQREMLEKEGHTIIRRGQRMFIKDYGKYLLQILN